MSEDTHPQATPSPTSRWPRPSASSRCAAASDHALAAAERAASAARDAMLRRLCRVSTGFRSGQPVRIYEVREPTPENLATVGQLLRRSFKRCEQTSGIAFAAA